MSFECVGEVSGRGAGEDEGFGESLGSGRRYYYGTTFVRLVFVRRVCRFLKWRLGCCGCWNKSVGMIYSINVDGFLVNSFIEFVIHVDKSA